MSTDTMAAPAQEPGDSQLHSPPASTGTGSKGSPPHKHDASDSELSDIEDPTDDIGEIEPDHYADDGRVPVFKPTMDQFKSFERYMKKINPYGMKSGIVKVVPPPEWKATQPRLDEVIKTIRVREPIKQDIMGTSGTYRQANILHQRSYNLPQWRQLCEQSEHQPPARRGERRLNQDKPAPPRSAPKPKAPGSGAKPKKKGLGRSQKNKSKAAKASSEGQATPDRLPTPVSPTIMSPTIKPEEGADSVKSDVDDDDDGDLPASKRVGGGRGGRGGGGRGGQSISVSSRRKYSRREASAKVDEAAFKDFEYELNSDEYTPERCEELERAYWKTLTYAPPLYGADMLGTLFDDRTTTWNLSKLENLLDVLGTKIPGVNTAYLYLGMWKATFAWHLEDVDLYSINYVHFGAPKQWYSISQGDARRFENAMKTIWPTDAKACDQFLRHKTFLISPSRLLQDFNIKVNKIVAHPGEFVITFPYGYHSGYNLGYNCAEAVNFALDSWLEYGRVAKKCDCDQAQDSVWIDVREIDRKLRGEETDFEETEDEDEEDDDEEGPTDLPTPPESSGDIKIKIKMPKKKRKRPVNDKVEQGPVKKIRVRFKIPTREPCILCPNDIPSEPLLPTEEGEQAHRMCALYIPETSIDTEDKEIVTDVKYINKARLELKCNYCRSKKGACFQCSQKKCTRAYHATCAAAAGVLVEQGEIPVFGEDGTEYKEWGIEFSCRFHRTKRDKKLEADELSESKRILTAAAALKPGDTCQMQYYRGDIFAGAVVENRMSEEMILVDILPRGDRIEVEYKWLLVPDPADFRLQKPSANAIPMPKSFKAKESLNTSKRQADDLPRKDDLFLEGFTWAEFHSPVIPRNSYQVKVDLSKENQTWYYLGKNSTEARAQFTEDLANPRHNSKGHFLDTIQKPIVSAPRQSYGASYPTHHNHQNAMNAIKGGSRPAQPAISNSAPRQEKPYVYKPRIEDSNEYRVDPQAYRSQQNFLHRAQTPAIQFGTDPRWQAAALSIPAPLPPASATPQNPQATSHSAAMNYNNTMKTTSKPPSSYGTPASIYKTTPKASYTPPVSSYGPAAKPQYDPAAKALHDSRGTSNTPARTSAGIQYTPMSKPPYSSTVAPPSKIHSVATPVHSALAPPIPRGPLAPPAQYSTQYSAQSSMPMNPFSGRPPTTPKPNVFRLYSYLQKEHNRSPLEYKSPYRPGGGFMNGYQGNLQKHLQQQFANKSAAGTSSILTYGNAQNGYPPGPAPVSTSRASYSSTTPQYGVYGMSNGMSTGQTQPGLPPHQVTKPAPLDSWEQKDKFHAAIREEYAKPHDGYISQSPTPSQSLAAVPQTSHDRYPAQHSQHYQSQPAQRPSQVLQPPQPYQQYHSHGIPQNRPPASAQPVYHSHGFPKASSHSATANRVSAAPVQHHMGTHSSPSQPIMAPPVQQHMSTHGRSYSVHSGSPVLASPASQYASTHGHSSQAHSASPDSVLPPQHYSNTHERSSNAPSNAPILALPAQQQTNQHQYPAPSQPSYPRPMYAHQQYFQKPSEHAPAPLHQQRPQSQLEQAQALQAPGLLGKGQSPLNQPHPGVYSTPQSGSQPSTREVIDVPADSASVVERMMMNLKRLPRKYDL